METKSFIQMQLNKKNKKIKYALTFKIRGSAIEEINANFFIQAEM
jgi:hypothetical protein